MAPHLWTAGAHYELLEQLRAIPLSRKKLIPLVILNALDEKPLPIYGKGDNIRDWLYVEDHARALVQVVESGRVGETYNVGGRNERTNLQVVEAICDVLDKLSPRKGGGAYCDLITFVTDRPGHDMRYAIDASKLETELADFHTFTNEGVTGYFTIFSDVSSFLNFYKRPNFSSISDRATVGINKVEDFNVLSYSNVS